MRLLDLVHALDAQVGRPATLSIVGTAKNVGKTTTLNWLIERLAPAGHLGLTSVGRDGEDLDAVTDLPKPRIRPPVGTLLATAEASARRATAPLVRVAETAVHTGLGPVGIYRVAGRGAVEIAGPVTVEGAVAVREALLGAGAVRVLVDGAIDRRASASPRLAEGVLLATGLAMAASGGARLAPMAGMRADTLARPEPGALAYRERTIEDSIHVVDLLTMNQSSNLIEILYPSCMNADGSVVPYLSGQALEDPVAFAAWLPDDLQALHLPGALSEGLAQALLDRRLPTVPIVLPDATHAVCRPATLARLRRRGHAIEVREAIRLLAVTCNPTAPHVQALDAADLLRALREALRVPVFDLVAQP